MARRSALPATTTQAELLAVVDRLNADPAIHGILVQMPLPKQIDAQTVIRRIAPEKDVDGFHPMNVGKLLIGDKDGFAPCTPWGVQAAARGVRREDRGDGVRDRRALEHRREADGEPDDAAGRERRLHGDNLPQPHARSCCAHASAQIS